MVCLQGSVGRLLVVTKVLLMRIPSHPESTRMVAETPLISAVNTKEDLFVGQVGFGDSSL